MFSISCESEPKYAFDDPTHAANDHTLRDNYTSLGVRTRLDCRFAASNEIEMETATTTDRIKKTHTICEITNCKLGYTHILIYSYSRIRTHANGRRTNNKLAGKSTSARERVRRLPAVRRTDCGRSFAYRRTGMQRYADFPMR